MNLLLYAAGLVALLLVSAFFSGSEAALYSLSRPHVRALRERSAAGRVIAGLLEQPRKLLVSILLGNLLVNIFTTSAATAIMLRLFGENGLGYAFLAMAALIMLFGEVLPKAIALHWAERFATLAIHPLRVFHTVVLPLRAPLSVISEGVISFLRRRIGQAKRSFTWQELVTALRISRREGHVDDFEFEMLTNVIEFRHKIVREIMTPSIHVESAKVTTPRGDLLASFARTGYSRMPITGETDDDIVGILHIKDLLDPGAATSEADLRARLREPYFVQENTSINQLYNELQERGLHIAVVVDEYTSLAGIVTLEDVLEELVGEIRDARDPKTENYMRLDERRTVVSGRMELDDFNDLFDTMLEDEDHDTIAGFVIGRVGKIPSEGETFELDGLRFHVVSAEPNRILRMRVEKIV